MRRVLLLACLLAAIGGCGSGKWLDVPMMSCSELEDEMVNPEDMMKTMVGPGICLQAGGLRYGDDYRCEDGLVQVLCEEA
ncbi:MAG TPA: hypothetical protein VFT98_08555 [Myxococcota bacterium]|nr:hypothetical protein [Myxococcota bacterium]